MKKKIIYSMVLLTLLMSCHEPNVEKKNTTYYIDSIKSLDIIVVDGCEYLYYSGGHRMGITHKGNCKFCKLREDNITEPR